MRIKVCIFKGEKKEVRLEINYLKDIVIDILRF